MKIIPYGHQWIDQDDIDAVVSVLKSDWLTQGSKIAEFEDDVAGYCKAKYAVALNSGTAGLHAACFAAGIKKGDEVITTPFTFVSTAHVIVHTGARVVFADIDRATYNIDQNEIVKKITPRTKAIIPVHYAGLPCNMDAIQEIAHKYNLYVIEDAAHAIGASYKGKKIGSLSDATCFSFYVTKNMTTGEGGAVTTNNEELADKLRTLRLHGLTRDAWKRYSYSGSWYYEVTDCGWKYVMTDVEAAMGIVQLKKLDGFIEKRKQYAEIYNEALKYYGIVPNGDGHVYHLYPFLVSNKYELMNKLKEQGIGTSVHFIPLHFQPYYKGYGKYPNAEWVYSKEIPLPLYPDMTLDDVEKVIGTIKYNEDIIFRQ